MRKIIYKCDCCFREYPYMLAAQDSDREVLYKFKNFELCNKCVKLVINYISSLCQQQSQ